MPNIDKYIYPVLIVGYVGKLLAVGASFPDALVILVIAAAHFLYNSQIQNKRVDALEEKVNKYSELVNALKEDNDNLKNSVANAVVGVKMSQGFKGIK